MLIYGAMSCIFGPMIGFFDVYYDMHVHCFVVALFVIGEVLYVFTATGVLNSCRTAFPKAAQSSIDTLVTCRTLTFVLGVITLGAKIIGKDIDSYGGAYIEWILFNMSFYIFTVLADIMPYDAIVVPEDEKDE
jgi:tetrahydromethanopterin S-methyltransferase subunit D